MGTNEDDYFVPHHPKPLLSRYWLPACILTISCFVIFEVLIQFDSVYSEHPLCRKDISYSLASQFSNCAQSGGYIITASLLFMKLMRDKSATNEVARSAYMSTLCCILIATASSVLSLIWNWGGICVDVFGVYSPAAMWLACAPMLMFITVSVEDKKSLSVGDAGLIISIFFSILFGLFMIFDQPLWSAWIWLVLSTLCFLAVYKLLYDARENVRTVKRRIQTHPSEEYLSAVELASRRINLCNIFAFICPLDVIVYFLAMAGAIDQDGTRIGFIISDMLTKVMFGLIAMDTHAELLHPATVELIEEKRANEARRNFLKYIFHEVRVPLNSLTMGIECLDRTDGVDEEQRETLMMMREASSFMSETLNDVLNMQKIEEGKLELDFQPFSLQQAIETVLLTFRSPVTAKQIYVVVHVDKRVPSTLIGDRYRIEHVIANLLSNAIKFSPPQSRITIDVTTRQLFYLVQRPIAEVTVAITDEGPGISEENQKKLFTSFMQIRPGELQGGRGSGVGLSICKQMVHLHGGSVSCKSNLHHGSTFSFTIPFETVPVPVPATSTSQNASRRVVSEGNRDKRSSADESKGPGGAGTGTGVTGLPVVRRTSFNQVIRMRTGSGVEGVNSTFLPIGAFGDVFELEQELNSSPSPRGNHSNNNNQAHTRRVESHPNVANCGQGQAHLGSGGSLQNQLKSSHHRRSTLSPRANPHRVAVTSQKTQTNMTPVTTSSVANVSSFQDFSLLPDEQDQGQSQRPNQTLSRTSSGRSGVQRVSPSGCYLASTGLSAFDDEPHVGPASHPGSKGGASGEGRVVNSGSGRRDSVATDTMVDAYEGPIRALVVDDVTSNRKMLRLLLEKRGLVADMAEDGAEALQLLVGDLDSGGKSLFLEYGLLFMDNMMPRLSGAAAAAALRRRGYAGIIVGLTGCAMEDDIEEYIRAGADIVLSKPLNMAQLDMILDYVRANGALSSSSMRLEIVSNHIEPMLRTNPTTNPYEI